MTDPTTCSNCGASVPGGAAFCTSCGTRVADAPEASAPPPPPADATTVDGPSLADPTLVAGAPVAPAPPAPPATPAAAPWAPPGAPAAPPPPGAPATAGAWPPPAPGTPPPGAPTFGAPTAAPPGPPTAGSWGDPAAAGAPWGAPAAAAATAAPKGPARSVLGAIVALLGGVLTIAGVFSGWVTLGPDGNTVTDSAWSLTTGDGFLKSNDPYLLVGLGVVAIVLALLLVIGVLRPLVRIGAIVVGIAIVVVAALNWSSISSFITDNFASDFKATTAIGFYLVIVGGVLTALAGLMPAKKS